MDDGRGPARSKVEGIQFISLFRNLLILFWPRLKVTTALAQKTNLRI